MIKVTLRQKAMTKGMQSLYLDFYPAIFVPTTKKLTRREFLKLHIIAKPKNPLEKNSNTQTLALAEQIRLKRENEINKPEIYNEFETEQLKEKAKGDISFTDYFKRQVEKRQGSNYDVWKYSFDHFKQFSKVDVKFNELTKVFCNDYKDYLLKAKAKRGGETIANNTAHSYFGKFKTTLKKAFEDEVINIPLHSRIATIEEKETTKQFLTADEVNSLANTDCSNHVLKQASLFSILTGLRFSDVVNLHWCNVFHTKDKGYSIRFKHKKTDTIEYNLPISNQAYTMLGEPQQSSQQIFAGLTKKLARDRILEKWTADAGITKHITFHCFRHTYATLQLEGGTDLFTVSKMLGHKNQKTTAIYAKIVDETKRKATDKINIDFKK
jgi:integrase